MDDTDLAGPILFCLLFATFLLLVLIPDLSLLIVGGKEPFRIRVWLHSARDCVLALHPKPHVANRRQFHQNSKCLRILSSAPRPD